MSRPPRKCCAAMGDGRIGQTEGFARRRKGGRCGRRLPQIRRESRHHVGVRLPPEVALPDADKTRIFDKGGFAEVDADRLTVLAERALPVASTDAATELAAAGDDAGPLAAASAVEQFRALGAS